MSTPLPVQQIPNHVGGRFKEAPAVTVPNLTVEGVPALMVHEASFWTIEAALETASSVQETLGRLPRERIMAILADTMEGFLTGAAELELASALSGCSTLHLARAIGALRDWSRDLPRFFAAVFPDAHRQWITHTAPVVAILPGNSVQEAPFIVAQVLLSQNALILRPSRQGAGNLVVHLLLHALRAAIRRQDDPDCACLLRAVSVIHCAADSPGLRQLFVEGWNYVIFGNAVTTRDFENTLRQHVTPRRVIRYGAGLSSSVICQDALLEEVVEPLAASVLVHRGNDCLASSIAYVHETHVHALRHALETAFASIRSGVAAMGRVGREDEACILDELDRQGHAACCRFPWENGQEAGFRPMVVPLHGGEPAQEYPGPVLSLRAFATDEELARLMAKDLTDNRMEKNLTVSIFTPSRERFYALLPLVRAYSAKWNKPTHIINLLLPHQGTHLLEALSSVCTIELDP